MNIIHIIIILLILIVARIIIKKRRKYFLVIVAIFKNENDYLEEWLNFHINQGIDHFYLYDNNDVSYGKETMKILNKYKDKITYIAWNNVETTALYTTQRRAYQHCVDTYSKEFKWIALADIDEFIYSTRPSLTIKQIINFYTNDDTPFIKVPRYNFGDSGYSSKQDSVVKSYIYREKNFSSYKAISNVDYIDFQKHTFGVHRFLYTTDDGINKDIKINNEQITTSKIPIAMNHYYTKSKEEYIRRCGMWANKRINSIGYRDNCFNENNYKVINKNEVIDITAKKLL